MGRIMRGLALTMAFALLCGAPSGRAEEAICKTFSWSLNEERSWFESASLKTLEGQTASPWRNGVAYRVAMKPADAVAFRLPPERETKPEADRAAIIEFAAVEPPGRYQVTLSDEAWIDVIQDSKYLTSVEHTGVKGCRGLRKSVRFVLTNAPVTLQLSGASVDWLAVAIRRID